MVAVERANGERDLDKVRVPSVRLHLTLNSADLHVFDGTDLDIEEGTQERELVDRHVTEHPFAVAREALRQFLLFEVVVVEESHLAAAAVAADVVVTIIIIIIRNTIPRQTHVTADVLIVPIICMLWKWGWN